MIFSDKVRVIRMNGETLRTVNTIIRTDDIEGIRVVVDNTVAARTMEAYGPHNELVDKITLEAA